MDSKLPTSHSLEKTTSQLRLPTMSSNKFYPSVIRRSERIQNALLPYQLRTIQPVLEQITVSESEKEDDNPQPDQDTDHFHHPPSDELNLHTKIDYILKLLETQQIIIKALKPKNDENPLLSGNLSSTDVRYKSLYFESQKKVQALMDENHQLTQKLETALCKVEVYEKGNRNFSEVLEKMKDVILVSNLTKVTETAVNASSRAIRDAMSPGMGRQAKPSAAKRKKMTKQSEKS